MAAPVYLAITGSTSPYACAAVEAYLPASHGIIALASWQAIVNEATAFVDSRLAPKYWPFPDIAGTPATPTLINAYAAKYGAYVALMRLGPSSRFSDLSYVEKLRADVTKALDDLCDDDLPAQVPMTVVTDEHLDLDTGYVAREHMFLCQPRDVDPASVTVSTRVRGVDFTVYWQAMANSGNGAWVLYASNSAMADGDHVSYSYSHLKRQQLDMPPGHDTIRLVRA
jgi:hypothetical protein